ncbi:MAG: hypothetical protein KC535_04260 [Nanoarchaeota archaeon]|nr:hypothetical protein [Nanoarchaeota archaeon]
MYILGISCYYHDASASLIRDGRVVAAAAQERFSQKKHDASFPHDAIAFCLAQENISFDDVDHVAFYEKPLLKLERVISQFMDAFPRSFSSFLHSMPSWINEKTRIIRKIRKLGYQKDIFFIEHHLSHASSFLMSPFDEAAILSVDGVGEWSTTVCAHGKNNSIEMIKELPFPHSLGLFYSAMTAFLGFSVNNSEYKVMGLGAYGEQDKNKNRFYRRLKKVIDMKKDGSFHLDTSYFSFYRTRRMFTKRLISLLRISPREKDALLTKKHEDLAAATQMIYEDALFALLDELARVSSSRNLVLTGGCALNSVANGKIISHTPFKEVWIQPDPGDGGASLGAASYAYHALLKKKRADSLADPFLGPSFSSDEVKRFLEDNQIRYQKFDLQELPSIAAKLIFENNIVGWFQGRMEWGPRALGARSILANPLNKKMSSLLNKRIKKRESFRPFAPMCLKDEVDDYFDLKKDSLLAPFMLTVCQVKQKWRETLPSVVHVDGSARVQTVTKDNSLCYSLLKEFKKLSGVPIIINTSFNVRGDPIVCSLDDAIKSMKKTDLDYLFLENYLIRGEDL